MTSFHMHISIRGALRMTPEEFAQAYQGVFTDESGRTLSLVEAHAELQRELALGHEIIPSVGCNNYDWVHGCLGHEEAKEKEVVKA